MRRSDEKRDTLGQLAFPAAAGAVDAHLHLFPDEASGLRAQGGRRLSGHAGVAEEVRGIRERGRIGRTLAVTTAYAELARRAEVGRWPEGLSGDERRRRTGELEDRLLAGVKAQNVWIRQVASSTPGIEAVVTADPTVDSVAMTADLVDLVGSPGVRAIKIHPALSYVLPDHPGYLEVYRLAQDAGIPVISHGGSSGCSLAATFRTSTRRTAWTGSPPPASPPASWR